MRHQFARVLQRERLDVDNLRRKTSGIDRSLALFDVLRARCDEQHVVGFRILFGRAQHFEVVTDFVHGERDVLICLQLDLGLEIAFAQAARHLDDLGDRRVT